MLTLIRRLIAYAGLIKLTLIRRFVVAYASLFMLTLVRRPVIAHANAYSCEKASNCLHWTDYAYAPLKAYIVYDGCLHLYWL